MCRPHLLVPPILFLALLLFACISSKPACAAGPHWLQISSNHFSVLTDAGENQGKEVILRFEQMRAVFGQLLLRNKVVLSEPLDIIAFKTTEEYAAVAPGRGGGPPATSGTFVPGDDRNYILLDLSDETSWQTVAVDFARVLLRYNYPSTPPWFDEGFLEYFSSLQLNAGVGHIGGDPGTLSSLLNTQSWLPLEELFRQKPSTSSTPPAAMFRAESWIVVHYLISNQKLPETGMYFGLVENQGVPVAQAIQQAYGVPLLQFEQAIQAYAHSSAAGAPPSSTLTHQFSPLTFNDVGTSSQSLSETEAEALVEEAAVRAPEHRAQAVRDLTAIGNNVKTDNAVAHRALAWVLLQKGDYAGAADELSKTADRNPHDPWMHFYAAELRHREGEASGEFPGLANIMQDLRAVIDWDPEFARAYDMLAVARLQGGGTNSALQVIRTAIELSPRDQTYLLHLAQIYLAGKKWDDASELLGRLQSSSNPAVASAARQDLEDLPTLRKYGVLPQRSATAAQPQAVWSSPPDDDEDSSAGTAPPAAPAIDRRKTEYLQGRLVAVDCSHSPVAIVTISAHGRVHRYRTGDYKSLLLIGADAFSCQWKNRPVVINYKAGGKTSGDLVSLELR